MECSLHECFLISHACFPESFSAWGDFQKVEQKNRCAWKNTQLTSECPREGEVHRSRGETGNVWQWKACPMQFHQLVGSGKYLCPSLLPSWPQTNWVWQLNSHNLCVNIYALKCGGATYVYQTATVLASGFHKRNKKITLSKAHRKLESSQNNFVLLGT